MNYDILLKFGEITLKGANRAYFENTLLRQVRYRIKPFGSFNVYKSQSTICVEGRDEAADMDKAYEACKKIFGVISMCRAYETEKDIEAIKKKAAELAPALLSGAKTFKADARRADKNFPLTSPEISAEVGYAILTVCPDVKVDVHDPDVVVRVEIRDEKAFISGAREKGAGGMPVTTNGKALLLLSGGIDSPVAGHMICRRGVKLEVIHFESFPYTSERALEKVRELAKLLAGYNGAVCFHTVSVTKIQEALSKNCDEEYFTLLLRRFMMKIAEAVARERECKAIVTGESVGQVASQTIDALNVTNSAVSLPVFRPCIGLDKEEIIQRARQIGTYETSVLPFEDCCTVFTPRHPKTKPVLENVLKEEARIDCEALIKEALETRRQEWIKENGSDD
jgi:thiamine biosynthesis protein ThiI